MTDTYSLILNNIGVSGMYQYMDILKKDGLTVNVDFHFKYHPPYHNNASQVEFIFFDSKYYIFYQLKWN